MFKRILSLLLLPFIMLLAACGSSDKAEPKEVILDLRLGTGVGSSFVESDMSASEINLSLGDDTTLSVNIVDLNDDGNLYTDDNRTVIFSSSCESSGLASFSSSTITTSSGLATTTYTASGCSGNDVVTASLSEDSSQSATVTLSTDNYSLSMGSGTGNSFEAEIIEVTDSSLDFGDTATLTVHIVDTNNNNDLFTDEEVSVAFSSSCISSGLSSLSESLVTTTTGIASTTYTTSGCSNVDQVIATVVDTDLTAEIELNTSNNDLQLGFGSSNNFANGILTASAVNLSATGQADIFVSIVDANNGNTLYTSEVLSIDFSSNCVNAESSAFSATSAFTSNGKASTTYTANSCRGEDIITATLSGTDKTAEVTINVTELELGSISAMEPDHTVLAIQGFSTEILPSTTELNFLVRDKSGNPFADKEVNFSLFGVSGGNEGAAVVSLNQEIDMTDSDGIASVFISSGYANTTFRVVARTDVLDEGGVATGQTMQTTSTAISVTTGLPVAHNFGSAVSVHNPRGWNYVSSGNEGVNISATASDLFGGAVVDGNTITFSTYGGRLEESSCVLENGICGVRWQSSETYRPIATILAYTLGEESFEDVNSNGQFDAEETFTPLAEPLRDDNRNGSYDSGEFFVDSNGNGEWDAAVADYNETVYRGGTCSDAARELGHCASLAYIYSQPELIMADDEVDGISVSLISGIEPDLIYTRLSSLVTVTIPADGAEYFRVLITDSNGVIPPAGTGLSVSCNSTDVAADTTQMLSEVPNEFGVSGLETTLNVKTEAVPDDGSITLTNRSTICFVNVEPEGSIGRGFSFTVNYQVDTATEEETDPVVE